MPLALVLGMAIETITQTPTRLTIHPDPANVENTGFTASSSTSNSASSRNTPKTAEADYSFWDFLDLINPLQHIPVVSTIYREITGDTIKPEMKLAGSTLLGGPLGFVAGLADVVYEQTTGKDIGSTMVASAFGSGEEAPVQTASLQEDLNAPIPVKGMKEDIAASLEMAPLPQPMPSVTGDTERDEKDERVQRLAMIDPMDKQVLELYGNSRPVAAAKAYQQADMRSYLQQASLNTSY